MKEAGVIIQFPALDIANELGHLNLEKKRNCQSEKFAIEPHLFKVEVYQFLNI